ncbi:MULTISPECIES: hypothetical protein [Nostoc]|uniref:Uncharacterized protein n=1 Tax=Nostoc paludosum FACHB-159 TaxID=2692908 RepID=A0ABR8KF48_9NOSO|nr:MULTISPECIES: hypothetical protein [Nostoc]MBD2736920.1 hypothetical protein [Nostoc paludosum FACHB-159]
MGHWALGIGGKSPLVRQFPVLRNYLILTFAGLTQKSPKSFIYRRRFAACRSPLAFPKGRLPPRRLL